MRLLPILLTLGIATMTATGCAYVKPATEIETDPQPLKEGGGLFTGRTGEWSVIRR